MKPAFVRRAFIYALGSDVYVNTVVRTRDGGGVGVSSISVVSVFDAAAVGQALRAALSASVDDAPNDIDPKESLKAILAASKKKTWSQFMRSAKLILAYQKPRETLITLKPTRYLGASQGSDHLDERSTNCSVEFPELLGASVVDALSLCE